MTDTSNGTRHTLGTRAFHTGLALAIVIQLVTSLTMEPPAPDNAGNFLFQLHQYSGLAAFLFVVGFWITVTLRRRGTEWGALLPWASSARRLELWSDARAHVSSMTSLRFPAYEARSPLASAIHGLGLLLMTAMAASGTLYYFLNTGDPDAGGLVGAVMLVHRTLGNLVWAYLIGHASIASIHHFTQHASLTEMWSLRLAPVEKGPSNEGIGK